MILNYPNAKIQIKSLPGNLFNQNPALKIAFLSHNEVDTIEDALRQGKTELKRVDLGDNEFESVGDIFEVSITHNVQKYIAPNYTKINDRLACIAVDM